MQDRIRENGPNRFFPAHNLRFFPKHQPTDYNNFKTQWVGLFFLMRGGREMCGEQYG